MSNHNCVEDAPIWRDDIADDVANALIETGSYIVDFTLPTDDWFKWKSGVIAPCYCDCRVLSSNFLAYSRIVKHMSELVKSKFGDDTELVVGIAASGISWSAQLAASLELPSCFVREKLKEHGVGRHVCCNPKRGSRAIIIDDLCASGRSTAKAIKALNDEYSIDVIGSVSIINWGFESMWNSLGNALNCNIWCLCSYRNLLRAAANKGVITADQESQLLEFYQNPFSYTWK